MTIRRQFVLAFSAFAVVVAAAGGWVAWSHTADALERELDEKLTYVAGAAVAVGLSGSTAAAFRPEDVGTGLYRAYRERLFELRNYVADAYIFARGGRLLVSTEDPDSLPPGTDLSRLETFGATLSEAWRAGRATTPVFTGEDDRQYKYGFVRLQQSDAMLAVLMRADFLDPLRRFRRNIFFGSAGAAVLAALLAGALATRVTSPLDGLSRAALRIQRGNLDEPVASERSDEVGRLARAMERMRQGIVERDEQLRLMLAQVAHEIRNPLGGLELFASAAAEAEEPEERDRLLKRIRTEVTALNRIIDDFLAFARPMEPDPVDHDVRDPLGEALELAGFEAERRGVEVQSALPSRPLGVSADPDHVKRIVLNLLRNGIQAGSRVLLAVETRGDEVMVRVRDDGPGLPEELEGRVFEPFVSEKEQGAGLGLAIVKRLAEVNGGRVEATHLHEGVGVGAEFRVYFTRAPDPIPAGAA